MLSETVLGLEDLLAQSSASAEFKQAVRSYSSGMKSELIATSPGAPRVKVLRVISKLLESAPALVVEHVAVDGRSGCSDFVGTLLVNHGEHQYRFVWDCRWRAQQQEWTDIWGLPDQAKAAQMYGYQCFKVFESLA